jgi:1,4-alpha-glucan branching enzyme
MQHGKLVMLLHAHLPFVRRPEHPRFLEENWFFEALTETYIPLVQTLGRLAEKGLPGMLNLSISPPLLHMLGDPLLKDRYSRHLRKLLELADKEVARYEGDPLRQQLAEFYRGRLTEVQATWKDRLNCDMIGALRNLAERGKLELLTCVGTHPFLPAYQSDPAAIRFQLAVTVEAYQAAFGKAPKGIWLPECGYFDGLDALLAEFGLEYFFVETHGILLSKPSPRYGVFEPIRTKNGLICMGRDQASSREVWSRTSGYPGHPEYREFFRDLCREMPRSYLGDYFFAMDCPIETGFKYARITGGENKELYRPWQAMNLAREHARLFVANREAQVEELSPHMEKSPVIVCPYDAELFGHWWYEGPQFIESVFDRVAASGSLTLASASEAARQVQSEVVREPAFSSWGEGGYGTVWINPAVDWIYPKYFEMLAIFRESFKNARISGFTGRVLAQMAREMLLLQSSDWAFMIHNHSAENFARSRVQEHYDNFMALRGLLGSSRTQSRVLEQLEKRNNIFPWMGPGLYRYLAR